ncbi:MAG TPA: hypothetical protein VF211_05750 [Burkholderiales bacterium]
MDPRACSSLQAGIRELFRDHPAICGLTINRRGEVALDCWPRESASDELCAEVIRRLHELVEGDRDAAHWLFGRTFARVLH